jgi:hypothetical protein
MTEPSTTGGCLCGGVRFELTRPAEAAGYCHCTRCQKRTGSASSAQARIDGNTFRLLQGEELVKGGCLPAAASRSASAPSAARTCSAAARTGAR